MKRIPVDAKLSVAAQPSEAEIAALGVEGVALLINNRPDDEEPGQLGSSAERKAAEAAGLAYLDLPVTGPTITEEAVRRFAEAVAAAPGPVVAHCRSGTRSLTLWAIAAVRSGRLQREEVLAFGAERGIDLAGALRWLDAHPEG
ncbi:TIGR01244 family sulfur transferase [Methylobacterium dankookense]|uniref:Beta-lactamase hydrolase-like protein n=1 Tax=Methylobacterium dankookense TaxID=560405 RepID=A0A564FS97_9HYPH|nr:TIGR01244 family sulfur transferase [Methylobacterium dankookense]GJD56559.1 Beta-lactamase hydrolase-like protein [Methylobacterium dankookense]VUF10972.1 Beta-lactamase hydrolase-like protein [Methylobacterium dankookense]